MVIGTGQKMEKERVEPIRSCFLEEEAPVVYTSMAFAIQGSRVLTEGLERHRWGTEARELSKEVRSEKLKLKLKKGIYR